MIDTATLQRLGLKAGEAVRFRKGETGRWFAGRMQGVAVDGSVTVFDANGAARSLRPERGGPPARQPWPADLADGQRRGDHLGATPALVSRRLRRVSPALRPAPWPAPG